MRSYQVTGIDPKTARSAWTQAAVYAVTALVLFVIWVIRKTLLVFATALMLAYLLYPFVDAIARRLPHRRTRALAASLPFVAIFSLLAVFGLFVRVPLRNEYGRLRDQVTARDFGQKVANWSVLGVPVGEHLGDMYHDSQMAAIVPEIGQIVRTALRYVLNLFIIPILSFFILKDGREIRDSVLEHFRSRRVAERILDDAHLLLLEYMRSLMFLCIATLCVFTVALSVMRVPYPILLAIVSFPLEFVPMVGPLTSAIVIIGVSHFNRYDHVPLLVAFLIVYRLFQDYVLSPHLMKKGVNLHPLLVLFGVFAGGEIGSVPGIFLSVPVLAMARLVFYEWRRSTALSTAAAASLSSG
jgi:predicted PurR-regulated permease PerM